MTARTQDSHVIRALARRLAAIEEQLQRLTRGSQLRHSSIEGGSLEVNDEEGQTVLSVGRQPDGRFAVAGSNGGVVVASELDLPNGSITETMIADDSISTPKLRANAVTTDKIEAGAVTADKIQANAIDGRTITGATISGGELITSDADGSYVHITDDPADGGAKIDMGLPTSAGPNQVPASLRTGVDPTTGSAATLLRGPNIDGRGSAEIYLMSNAYGGSLEILSNYFWLEALGGTTWRINGDWELARPRPEGGWEIYFQVWNDGSVHIDSLDCAHDAEVRGNLTVRGKLQVDGVGSRQFKRKTLDESRTSNAFMDDDDLWFSVAANATYTFRACLWANSAAANAGDLNLRFTFPAGATLTWGPHGLNNAPTGFSSGPLESQAFSGQTVSPSGSTPVGLSTIKNLIIIEGNVRTGATSGFVRLQTAQMTTNANASTVLADSYLVAVREA